MIGIYKITNKINGKVYIGQSINIKRRWKDHRTHYINGEYPLYLAMIKYGIENFSFEVIEECEKEKLNDREIYWISLYNSNNKNYGYNATKGGECFSNTRFTEKEILEIYDLLREGISQIEIAKRYNVAQPLISGINTGEYYCMPNIKYPIKDREKKHWYCKYCGKEITKGQVRCIECANKMKRCVERPNKDELKQLIRTLPFTKIGEMFGVSDNAIRKWCDAYNLPRKKQHINSYSDEEWELI